MSAVRALRSWSRRALVAVEDQYVLALGDEFLGDGVTNAPTAENGICRHRGHRDAGAHDMYDVDTEALISPSFFPWPDATPTKGNVFYSRAITRKCPGR
jgi:hypothetical protein